MEDHIGVLFVVLAVLALMQLANLARSLARISSSLETTASMMKRLLAHQGIAWQADLEPSAQVKALALDARSYVAAIRAYREQTGSDLKQAKAVIDRLARGHAGAA